MKQDGLAIPMLWNATKSVPQPGQLNQLLNPVFNWKKKKKEEKKYLYTVD